MLRVNVKGAWLCAKAAVSLMREAGGGSIVNMASEVAFSGSPGLAHYVTSKAAIIGLTRVLARASAPLRSGSTRSRPDSSRPREARR